jgi:3-hydroxyisobutyrate dehydrogenase-like beta-hydroxyacid dehydrogenase
MGHALAERLLAGGHAVTVWNRTPHKADDLVAKGVRSAATPAEAAQNAEATFMSLADDDAVRAVVCGSDGAAAGIGDGILVDASTVCPSDYFGHLPLVAPALRNRLHDIVSGDHKGWFATTLGAKDLRLAEELARAHRVAPLAEAVTRLYERAAAEGWSHADIGAVVELVRRGTPSSAADLAISGAQQRVG